MGSTLYSKREKKLHAQKRGIRKRLQTFKTEEAAKAYAEKKKIKNFKVNKLRSKYRIEVL